MSHPIPTRDEFAALVTEALLMRTDVESVHVDVSDWCGYGDLYRGADDTWVDPVYIVAEDEDEEEEFYDAVTDLGDPTVSVKDKVSSVAHSLICG